MKDLTNILSSFMLLLISSAAQAQTPIRCTVTGGGVLAAGDHFALNATATRVGNAHGSMMLQTPYGYTFQSNNIELLHCTQDGGAKADYPEAPQRANFYGSGLWNGEDGYLIVVHTEDRSEPTDMDYTEIRILDSDANLVYRAAGFLVSGNVQHYSINKGRQ